MSNKLHEISSEIRAIVGAYQKKHSLKFYEEEHKYEIMNSEGKLISDLPSVSTLIKRYENYFDAEAKALEMCNYDVEKQQKLLLEWKAKADYATSLGSRCHYLLEKYLLSLYGDYKEVRKPFFECDLEAIEKSNKMIFAGVKFIDKLHSNGCVLLDTEMVLGNLMEGYFGQPDKVWLVNSKKNIPSILITDWKTNKPEKFKPQSYDGKMLKPFDNLDDTALGHYSLQLPLYGRLLKSMLKGTKYENIEIISHIIVNIKDNGEYDEYRVDKDVVNKIKSLKI